MALGQVAALAALAATMVITPGPGRAQAAEAAGPASLAVLVVDVRARPVGQLPPGFAGLSFESAAASGGVNSGRFDVVGNLPQLLRTLGPGVLRFGGSSVDLAYSGASQGALAGLRRLADATEWKVLYSENLGRFNAPAVVGDARAVATVLGPDLLAFACGNEPNLYPDLGLRPAGYSPADYLPEADACLNAVHSGAPDAPLAGPDLEPPSWLAPYALHERGRLALVTEHYYPLSDCAAQPGTATDLLSPATAHAEADAAAKVEQDGAAAGAPWRVSETNSAACSGIPGVSDTFAAALWALDYALILAEHGAAGMNLHTSLSVGCDAYSPVCATAPGHYLARPVYYGLLALRTLGTGQLIPVHEHGAGNLAAHAVRDDGGGVRLAVENLGPTPVTTLLTVAGTPMRGASIGWLTAPSVTATGGVTLDGASVDDTGTFAPSPDSALACTHALCPITLPAHSAALILVPRSR